MLKNKYNIVTNFPKKKISTKNVVDLLYSVFSFKLLNEYFINYLFVSIFDNITKKLSSKNILKINKTTLLNKNYFNIEYLYWSLSEAQYEKNKNNLLFQKKIYNLEALTNVVENIIISTHKSVGLKISEKDIEKIKNNVFKKMDLRTIIPFLFLNHLPPLASKDAFKNQVIKNKKVKNAITKQNGVNYYLYRENDIVSKIPISYISTGFSMKQLLNIHYINVDIKHFIISEYEILLKKRFTDKSVKKDYFNNAVFYLLTYYKLNGFLTDTGLVRSEIPKFKNKKLKKLYSAAIELVGTPFTVPIDNPYFGLFPDIEQYFGSLGSFYDVNPVSGTYSIQFPLSIQFIENTIKKVNTWLDNAYKNGEKLTFLLWIPLNIYDIHEDFTFDLKTSIYGDKYETFISNIESSKYLLRSFFYFYDKKATSSNSTHIIYVLSVE